MGAKCNGAAPDNRDKAGRFLKGHSGNEGGRPQLDRDLAAAAREFTTEVLERLGYWLSSDNPKASISAAAILLDRGYGKPTQRIEFSIEDYIHELREKHPSLDDDAANVIARRAQEFWQRTG